MNKRKRVILTKDPQLVIEEVNKKLPLDLKELYTIVDKIHYKYPLCSKTEITYTVFNIIESMRELLISGNILNFNKYIHDMRLFAFKKEKATILKIKIKTPLKIKKNYG